MGLAWKVDLLFFVFEEEQYSLDDLFEFDHPEIFELKERGKVVLSVF